MMLERQFHKPASKQYRAEILRKLKLAP
jgi:hypothetical protein